MKHANAVASAAARLAVVCFALVTLVDSSVRRNDWLGGNGDGFPSLSSSLLLSCFYAAVILLPIECEADVTSCSEAQLFESVHSPLLEKQAAERMLKLF